MWLYIPAFVLLIFGVLGSILSGGIFTIIVLPLGAIILLGAFVTSMWGRSSGASVGPDDPAEAEPRPLPHTDRPQPGTSGPSSPSDLVDARRQAQ